MEGIEETLSSVSQVLLTPSHVYENAGTIPSQIRVEIPSDVEPFDTTNDANMLLDFSSSITAVATTTLPPQPVYHPTSKKTKFPIELLNMNIINPLGERVFNSIIHDCRVKGYDETLKYGKKNIYLKDLHGQCFNDDGIFNQ